MTRSLSFNHFLKSLLGPLTRHFTYTVSFGGVKIRRKGGLGFLQSLARRHPTPEEKFLASLQWSGKTVYDVGGYIGLLSIFFARKIGDEGKVVVFEPLPDNCRMISEHLALNGVENVQLINMGLGDQSRTLPMAVRRGSNATASLAADIQAQILNESGSRRVQVQVDTLDHVVEARALPPPDFIKLDVEGYEYPALIGMEAIMKHHAPDLFLEIHGVDEESKRQNIGRIVELLCQRGYAIRHIESGQPIERANAHVAKAGHIYCTKPARNG